MGEPQNSAGPEDVTIIVIRNNYNPQFTQSFSEAISQNTPPGTSVVTVTTTDDDQVSPFNEVKYSIIGDDSAPGYFSIHETTGVITVTNNLENDGTRLYKVSPVTLDFLL